MLQRHQGIGIEIVGPREVGETRRLLDFARRLRLPHSWIDPAENGAAAALIEPLDPAEIPIVRLPGGAELRRPSNGELSRALGIGLELGQREEVDLLVVGGGPAGLGAAVYGASEGLDTLVIESTVLGGQAGTSRRIENYLGFPAGISGSELTSRAVSQARKFHARTATPYRARALEPGGERHLVRLEEGNEIAARAVLLSTGAEYRRLPVEDLDQYEGLSVFYAAGPPEAQLCGAQRVGVDRRRQLGGAGRRLAGPRRRPRHPPAPPRRPARDDVQLPDRRDRALRRLGPRPQRSRAPCTARRDGSKRSPSPTAREVPLSFLFLFLGASPCTEWLGDVVARDGHGFVLTGAEAGAEGLLETSVPGVYAAGDVRAGSIKRCATAVGEGATVVRFVHERLTPAQAPRDGRKVS